MSADRVRLHLEFLGTILQVNGGATRPSHSVARDALEFVSELLQPAMQFSSLFGVDLFGTFRNAHGVSTLLP